MEPIFLTVEEVELLHQKQIARFGGSHGLRDRGALESAVAMPAIGFGDQYAHEDLAAMAGAYLFHIVKNHPFVDGNKRAGLFSAIVFLRLNGFSLKVGNKKLEEAVIAVAASEWSKDEIILFIRKHMTSFADGG